MKRPLVPKPWNATKTITLSAIRIHVSHGVLGAYLLLFPRKRVRVLMLWSIISVPAVVAVGLWFLFQVLNGLGYLGGGSGGGVAYAAHVGGFVVGLATVRLWAVGRRQASPPRQREYYR